MNHNSPSQAPMTRRYKKPIVAMTMAVVGALALSPLADGASASTGGRGEQQSQAGRDPAGTRRRGWSGSRAS